MQISATHLSSSGNSDLVAGPGSTLVRVTINTVGLTIELRDGATHTTGNVIGALSATAIGTFEYGIPLTNGLSLVVGGSAGDATVVTSSSPASPTSAQPS